MKVQGICSSCGRPSIQTCSMCGQNICTEHAQTHSCGRTITPTP